MPNNIFLTKKCNLACPYCFASEFVNQNSEEFSIENFKQVLSFIKKESEQVGLIGGEPTLHSKFDEILDILTDDARIKTINLYTNGLNLNKYKDKLANKKFKLLINCNSENIIGKSNFKLLEDNIKNLCKVKQTNINLGINIYSQEQNFSFIFDLLKYTNSHVLRLSYSLPNFEKENINNTLESFVKIKQTIIKLYQECLKHKIIPSSDCNSLPYCLYDKTDKNLFIKIIELSKELNINYNQVAACETCRPVLDIFPDLTVGRCFGLAKYYKVNMNDFASLSQITTYFINKIDLYARLAFVSEKCADCKFRLADKCNVCFAYKLPKAMKIEEYCRSI